MSTRHLDLRIALTPRRAALTFAALLVFLAAGPVRAQVALPAAAATGSQTPRFGITLVDLGSGLAGTPAFEITHLYDTPLFWRVGIGAGMTASLRGAVYGYGGLHLPLDLPGGFVVRPSVSVGLYESGEGMDLGHALQFRSGIVVERRITRRLLLSGLLYHMSNAGLGRRNPGMEGLGLGITYLGSDSGADGRR